MRRFNVRVYGLLIDSGRVLVSDEFIKGNRITKFPGGGLEFGEGTIDCVKREFMEELNLPVEVISHFYTTDFFVASAFAPDNQVISIYYLVKAKQTISIKVSKEAHQHDHKEGSQSFRWIPMSDLNSDDLTLIIDKRVAEMLSQ
jgi:8-oxo-dGTP diphosphatase